ncbi:MAG: Error-prone repair protein ImuA [Bacteroidota bacterium]
MTDTKKDILHQLQREILSLQGFKLHPAGTDTHAGRGTMANAFPMGVFPVAAVHEFLSTCAEQVAATCGFVSGLLAGLMQGDKTCVWISMSRTLYPPALKAFGIEPDRIIFIDLTKQKDLLWAMEEALKCEGLAAVVGEIQEISFTASRRLQLAVEKSRVTGFILRQQGRNMVGSAFVSRWKIHSLPSEAVDGLPGIGLPRWNIELLKIRNGKPGSWVMEWSASGFQQVYPAMPLLPEKQIRKTG